MLLDVWDLLRGRMVTGDAPVTVSMTTHGRRLASVHTSLQSIIAGSVRPARLILWLNPDTPAAALPRRLQRLRQRGLEVRYARNLGPHTKYYPYVEHIEQHVTALVTADDDVIYPRNWLRGLLAAHRTAPELIHCYWAKRMAFRDGRVLPYINWPFVRSSEASRLHFALGVSGVLYPPAFLTCLRNAGDAFLQQCPRADDIWLHAIAIRNGYRVRQVDVEPVSPRLVPSTQSDALHLQNNLPAGNDAQIVAVYTRDELNSLASEAASMHADG